MGLLFPQILSNGDSEVTVKFPTVLCMCVYQCVCLSVMRGFTKDDKVMRREVPK